MPTIASISAMPSEFNSLEEIRVTGYAIPELNEPYNTLEPISGIAKPFTGFADGSSTFFVGRKK